MTVGYSCRAAGYRLLAKHLPPTSSRGGKVWGSLRRAIVSPMFLEAGRLINIESGAEFTARQIRIGDHSAIGVNCRVVGPVTLGDNVMMGPDVLILTQNHGFSTIDLPMRLQASSDPKPVVIEDDVWLGARAILLPGVRVGRGSIVGAAAVVTRDVEPYSIVAGNPARVVNTRVIGRTASCRDE